MTKDEREEAKNIMSQMIKDEEGFLSDNTVKIHKIAIKALEQEPCEMTAEEYRQRMIQAFHNADTDELIAICVLPTEKEFEHLEWLLKNHYKKEPCGDAISRQAAIDIVDSYSESQSNVEDVTQDIISDISALPPATHQQKTGQKTGHWIYKIYGEFHEEGNWHCSGCDYIFNGGYGHAEYCPKCGYKMSESPTEEVMRI